MRRPGIKCVPRHFIVLARPGAPDTAPARCRTSAGRRERNCSGRRSPAYARLRRARSASRRGICAPVRGVRRPAVAGTTCLRRATAAAACGRPAPGCGHVLPARLAVLQATDDFLAHAQCRGRVAQRRKPLFHRLFMQGQQRGVARGKGHRQVGLGQQQAVVGLHERRGTAEGAFEGVQVRRRRETEMRRQRLRFATRDPLAQRQQRQQRVRGALRRHRARAAHVAHDQPAVAALRLQLERCRARDEREIAGQFVQRRTQVRAGQRRIAHHVEIDVPRCQRPVHAQHGIAGALHRQLPQPRHFVRTEAPARIFQSDAIDRSGPKQRGRIDALRGEHLAQAAHPGAGTGALHQPPAVACVAARRRRYWPGGSLNQRLHARKKLLWSTKPSRSATWLSG